MDSTGYKEQSMYEKLFKYQKWSGMVSNTPKIQLEINPFLECSKKI